MHKATLIVLLGGFMLIS